MFCRNCGEQYQTDQAVMCVKCGTAKGQGANFCPNCGKPVNPGADICTSCGVAMKNVSQYQPKSKLTAGLLGIFLGTFGVHNFYLGYTTKAVIQLVVSVVSILLSCCTVGITIFIMCGISIWGLIEGIMILCGKIDKDGKGNPLGD